MNSSFIERIFNKKNLNELNSEFFLPEFSLYLKQ